MIRLTLLIRMVRIVRIVQLIRMVRMVRFIRFIRIGFGSSYLFEFDSALRLLYSNRIRFKPNSIRLIRLGTLVSVSTKDVAPSILTMFLILYIATETLETKKLELEATKLEWEKHHEEQKMELEQQKLAQESEQWKSEREDRSLQWKVEMEERRALCNAQIVQAGLEKGHTIEQIMVLLDVIYPTQFNK